MRIQPFLRIVSGLVILVTLAVLAARGQDSDPVESPTLVDDSLLNNEAPFLVMAQVNHSNLDYRQGDSFSVRVASEEDAFVYVLYQQADGQICQIFPNRYQPNNRLAARQAVDIPARNDMFRWAVGPPFGKEVVKVIASRTQLDVLSDPRLQQQRFNPVSAQSFKGIELELGEEEPSQWAETDIAIHTYARGAQLVDRGRKRFGVFLGVSKHMFREEKMAATEEDNGNRFDPDLKACHRDAQKLGAAMHKIGRLNDFKIFTNDQATKANIQEAITQWLPRRSRPGDTVFICYSGHTGKIPDLDGDEPDGEDEYLVPHDYVDADILEVLQRKISTGEKDSPPLRERIHHLSHLSRQAGTLAEVALTHETCITDDLLARWLQRLSGRQVILIMDTCHSAGYTTNEDAPQQSRGNASPDMLGREFQRLRDMGQPQQALLASTLSHEGAAEFIDKSMGVMTFFLVESIEGWRGPLRLEEAFTYCQENMRIYFDRLENEMAGPVLRHQPFVVNYCTDPVYVKP